ncbi:MAG: SatD family protein [Planctomycetota bacterium]
MGKVGTITESVFVAVTADVVASRQHGDRKALQKQLLAALRSASDELGRALVADAQLTAGDEVQALLRTPTATMRLLQLLSDAVHPTQFTFGIGFGTLSTSLPSRRAARRLPLLDGPCFHHARTALEEARSRGAWAAAHGFGPWQEPLNALLELLGNLRQGWTEKQGQYAGAARTAAQKDVAKRFGVNPSVVSESLKGARLELVRRGEHGAEALLRQFTDSAEFTQSSVKRPNPSSHRRDGTKRSPNA